VRNHTQFCADLGEQVTYTWPAATLQICFITLIVYWWRVIPPSGDAVAALALAAAIMAVRGPRFTRIEEMTWILIAFAFFSVEIHAINRDRQTYADQQTHETNEFQGIASGLTVVISESQLQMQQLTKTLRNTEPRAIIDFRSIAPVTPPIESDIQEYFNVNFVNVGNDIASDLRYGARIYVETLDDRQEQREAADEFNRWWNQRPSERQGATNTRLAPGSLPIIFSFRQTFTKKQIEATTAKTKTFYYLVRVVYSDHSGRWVYDFCAGKVDPVVVTAMTHSCVAHNDPHYAAPKDY
jgi:hypothetical protein